MGCCWQDLPPDLVRSLAERLSGADDLFRLGAVCRPWSEALTAFRPVFFPWLVLSDPTASLSPLPQVPIYSPNNHRLTRFRIPTLFFGDFRVVGCHHGWLVAVDVSLHVHVFNPVTRDRAYLPSLTTLPSFTTLPSSANLNAISADVQTVALSSTPSAARNDGVIAAAILFDRSENVEKAIVVFAKVGDDAWSGRIRLCFSSVAQVIYYRGNFFAMSSKGRYQIINPSGGPVAAGSLVDPLYRNVIYSNLVLSPSSGHLLAVGRAVEAQSTRFVVRKFNPDAASSGSPSRWVEIKDLGDESLFVGGGHAMLLPLGNNGSSRIRRNCIYFIHKSGFLYTWSSNVEVFDIEKGVFEPSLLDGQPPYWKSSMFWFLPSLS